MFESHYNAAVMGAAQVAAAVAAIDAKGSSAEDLAELSIQTFAAVLDEALSRLGDGDEEEDDDEDDEDDESEDEDEKHD